MNLHSRMSITCHNSIEAVAVPLMQLDAPCFAFRQAAGSFKALWITDIEMISTKVRLNKASKSVG